MNQTSRTILFFGTEDFSLAALRALVEVGFTVGAVITKPDARRGRGKAHTQPQVKTYALQHNIPVWQPHKLEELIAKIAQFNNPVGVLVSYGKIIPQSIIDLFAPGIINVHPSLLPHYRGPTPIESAIANGDSKTGVSIMKLSAAMDAGPVYSQIEYNLNQNETKPELYQALSEQGARELIRVLPDILAGALHSEPQDESQATYCQLLSKQDTLVDPTLLTASEIERRVRAHLGFPKTRLPFLGDTPIILQAHVSPSLTAHSVACKDNTFLEIDRLVAPSGKAMQTAAYLNGRRN